MRKLHYRILPQKWVWRLEVCRSPKYTVEISLRLHGRERRGGKKAVFSKNKMEMWGEGGCLWMSHTQKVLVYGILILQGKYSVQCLSANNFLSICYWTSVCKRILGLIDTLLVDLPGVYSFFWNCQCKTLVFMNLGLTQYYSWDARILLMSYRYIFDQE